MYSSGGDLHLELPTGQQGGTGKLWVSPLVPAEPLMQYGFDTNRLSSSCFPGDSSVRDEGGDESQLLVQGRGQPHGFHQDQNQRPRRGPVHHPPSGGGGHLRCVHPHLSVNRGRPLCAIRLMFYSLLPLQLLVFTPPQRCLTLVHCDHKVPILSPPPPPPPPLKRRKLQFISRCSLCFVNDINHLCFLAQIVPKC